MSCAAGPQCRFARSEPRCPFRLEKFGSVVGSAPSCCHRVSFGPFRFQVTEDQPNTGENLCQKVIKHSLTRVFSTLLSVVLRILRKAAAIFCKFQAHFDADSRRTTRPCRTAS